MLHFKTAIHLLKKIPLEAYVWTAGLIFLAVCNPHTQPRFSLCPLHAFGFEFCPGCGLGHSVSLLLHGEFYLSFITHPLGGAALFILLFRIITLTKKSLIHHGQNY